MSKLEDPGTIEATVGAARHPSEHRARAVSSQETVYVLHSAECAESVPDLRDCEYSLALDRGIDLAVWGRALDRPVTVRISRTTGLLVPSEVLH